MKDAENEIVNGLKIKLTNEIQDLNPEYVEEVFAKFTEKISQKTSSDSTLITEDLVEMRHLLFNNYSSFFRNPITMSVLEMYVLPALLERRFGEGAEEIRIWSAACSEGQEPYSLAMLLEDQLLVKNGSIKYRIIATDLIEDNLRFAKEGVYGMDALEKISLGRFRMFFKEFGSHFQIIDKIRDTISFQFFDLLNAKQHSPSAGIFGSYDLIYCSNVLIYYKPDVQQAVLERIAASIAPRGLLVVGEAERALVRTDIFQELIPLSGVFQKRILPYFS